MTNEKMNEALKLLAVGMKDKENQTLMSFPLHVSSCLVKVSESRDEYLHLYTSLMSHLFEMQNIDFDRRKKHG